MTILEDFFSTETTYYVKRMELLRYSPFDRKHKIVARLGINDLSPNKIKVRDLNELLFFYDDSLWGNAKGGFLITDKAFFIKEYNDSNLYYWDWDTIKDFDRIYYPDDHKILVQFRDSSGYSGAELYADHNQGVFLNNLLTRIFKHKIKLQKIEDDKLKKIESGKRKIVELERKKKKLEEEKKRKAELAIKKKLEVEKKKQLLAEQKKKEAMALEKKKKAEKIHIETNSYYFEVEKNNKKSLKGPYTKQEMDGLLDKNEITLTTKVKFGLHKKTLKQLRTFPEFTIGLEDFL